jgi:hypothetical protein
MAKLTSLGLGTTLDKRGAVEVVVGVGPMGGGLDLWVVRRMMLSNVAVSASSTSSRCCFGGASYTTPPPPPLLPAALYGRGGGGGGGSRLLLPLRTGGGGGCGGARRGSKASSDVDTLADAKSGSSSFGLALHIFFPMCGGRTRTHYAQLSPYSQDEFTLSVNATAVPLTGVHFDD